MIEAYKLNFKFDGPVRIAWKTFHHNEGDLLLIKQNKEVGYNI